MSTNTADSIKPDHQHLLLPAVASEKPPATTTRAPSPSPTTNASTITTAPPPNIANRQPAGSMPGKLFVGGLSWQTTAAKLQEYFGVFGPVCDVMIMRDPVTQRSRGFGFVTFFDPQCVEQVLQVTTHILDGKRIDAKHATPHQQRTVAVAAPFPVDQRPIQSSDASLSTMPTSVIVARPPTKQQLYSSGGGGGSLSSRKMFVGGIGQDTTADEVEVFFGQFGQVVEVVLPMDQQTQRHRGFGFVTFIAADVVDQLCREHYHTLKQKQIECKRAQPRQPMSENITADHAHPAVSMAAATAAAAAAASQEYLQNRMLLNAGMQMLTSATAGNGCVGGDGQQHVLAMPHANTMTTKNPFMSYHPTAIGNSGSGGYGKLMGGHYQHSSSAAHRYSPYSMPSMPMRSGGQQTHNAANQRPGMSPAHHNTGVTQGNENVPSGNDAAYAMYEGFQGFDWNTAMYVLETGLPY